ncbi:hypothetical protein IWW51_006139 [Coemansia sp. RSA 2702]|nr:hypothetical protein IWW51_006139 [Coemansia sp. RSA 2702]
MLVTAINSAKGQLRQQMRRKLAHLSAEQLQIESQQTLAHITGHPAFQRAQHVSIYISMDAGELQTRELIELAQRQNKRVYVPRCDGAAMQMVELRGSVDELKVNKWGIREPREDDVAVDPAQLEFVVVPGVAFDRLGGRCGHGKGYYDRYLPQTRAFACAVCLCDQVVDSVPVDTYDRKPDMIVYPKGILYQQV